MHLIMLPRAFRKLQNLTLKPRISGKGIKPVKDENLKPLNIYFDHYIYIYNIMQKDHIFAGKTKF